MVMPKSNPYPTNLTWDDLPDCAAVLSNLNDDTITQCGVLVENRQVAHLFLLNDGLLALTDVMLPDETEPDNRALLVIGRVIVAHRRACKAGRTLV
jgi:hypothetical protein